ncbi:MKK3, partial [Symbiodinium sp. KB8]
VYYALKCIGLYMKDMRSMLLTELRTLFQSDCDALVSFHGATYREGQVAVVLEYLNLGGLEGIMAKAGPIPEHVLACMAYQVLWALGYLAYERRIHRDIKPANILVDTSGNVKLTDFGISREMQTAMLAKTFVGTFKYMAPERISGMEYDYASDLWSFGLVILEAALGHYPYPESKSTVPAVPEDGSFTPQFKEFIEGVLVKDPKKRLTPAQLLDSEWMLRHGCDSLEGCAEVVAGWLAEKGFKSDIPTAAEIAAEGKDSDPSDAAGSESKK